MSLRLGRPDHFSDVGSDYSSVSSSSGEVRYRRTLRCGPHPALLGLEDRAEVMLNKCVPVNEWMKENGSSAVGDKFVGHVRRELEEIVAGLRLTRVQIRTARKALG